MARRYPEGLIEWVQGNYLDMDVRMLTARCNEKFGTELTVKAMGSLKKRYNLAGAPRARVYSQTFPHEICEFIEANYLGTGHKDMAAMIQKEFGQEYTANQIKSYYSNHDLNSGLTGHFEPGRPSHNKGVKMSRDVYQKVKKTMFKPGNRPHNAVPVGTIVLATAGYYKVKVAEPDVWEFCHVREWKNKNGDIPEGMIVSFKDGNHENWNIDNLMLISREESLLLTNYGMRYERADTTETGLNLVRLKIAVRNRKKKRRKDNGTKG